MYQCIVTGYHVKLPNLPTLQDFLAGDHLLVIVHSMHTSHDDRYCTLFELRPPSATKHLHDLKIRILLASNSIAPVGHSTLDDYHMTGQIHTNSKSRCATNYVDVAL